MEAKLICDRCLGFDSAEERKRAVQALADAGWNYVVFYRDTQSEFALQYGRAAWVPPGTVYVDP